jgi:hypothetical protein
MVIPQKSPAFKRTFGAKKTDAKQRNFFIMTTGKERITDGNPSKEPRFQKDFWSKKNRCEAAGFFHYDYWKGADHQW